MDSGVWIGMCYDKDKEESHRSLWEDFITDHQAIDPDGIVLEDPILSGMEIASILEILPERVIYNSSLWNTEWHEKVLAELEKENAEDRTDPSEATDWEHGTPEYLRTITKGLCHPYHAACVVSHIMIEDKATLDGEGVLQVFLDDCGNVVSQLRGSALEVDNFDGSWFEGNWVGCLEYGGEVGPAYLPGGSRGPPYRLGLEEQD